MIRVNSDELNATIETEGTAGALVAELGAAICRVYQLLTETGFMSGKTARRVLQAALDNAISRAREMEDYGKYL